MSSYRTMGILAFHSTTKFGRVICATTMPFWKTVLKPWKAKQYFLDCATHTAVWFKDKNNITIYYEALEGEGWRGPFPLSKAFDWAEEKPERWVKKYDLTEFLGLSWEAVNRRAAYCFEMLGVLEYSKKQLPLLLRTAGVARMIFRSTPLNVTCSEIGSRVCHSDVFDFREFCHKKHHDYITPEGIHRTCETLRAEV